jgi:hypothetical protein
VPLPATPPIAAPATAWEAHSLRVTTLARGKVARPSSPLAAPDSPNAAMFSFVAGASHSNPSMDISRHRPRNAPGVSSSATGPATCPNSSLSGS